MSSLKIEPHLLVSGTPGSHQHLGAAQAADVVFLPYSALKISQPFHSSINHLSYLQDSNHKISNLVTLAAVWHFCTS